MSESIFDAYNLSEIIKDIADFEPLMSNDIPNIDLYMDQVTTIFDKKFSHLTRHDDDPVFTKTMINNYVKHNLVPSPQKKKYTPNHMISFMMIFILKQIITTSDIKDLLAPVKENGFFEKDNDNFKKLYDSFTTALENEKGNYVSTLSKKIESIEKIMDDNTELDDDKWKLFVLVNLLTAESYANKLVADRIIDKFFKEESK